MMIFHVDVLNHLRQRARELMADQVLMFSRNNEEAAHLQLVEDHLKTTYEMAYYTAMHEVCSTPWEYQYTCLNVQSLNEMSAAGWEMAHVVGGETPIFIWRRRKAVAEIAAKERPE